MDANQQQQVLILTLSCVATVDVLMNGQALSTQAQRSALTHFAICPFVDLLLHQLRLCARWPSSLPGQVQVPTLIMPFPIRVHKLLLRRGNIDLTLLRNSRLKFDMEVSQPFQQDNIIIPPCRVSQHPNQTGRVSTS